MSDSRPSSTSPWSDRSFHRCHGYGRIQSPDYLMSYQNIWAYVFTYASRYAVFKVHVYTRCFLDVYHGDREIRTLDPLLARQVLSQLSYAPLEYLSIPGSLPVHPPPSAAFLTVGLSGLEPPTSRLSGVRSNQLSYKPI